MKQFALLVLTLSSLASGRVYSESRYNLRGCAVRDGSVHVSFATDRGAIRRLSLGPTGVDLGGDVNGSARLNQVKELRLAPNLEIRFVASRSVEFGALTSGCRDLVRQIGKSLVPLRDADD